MANNQVIAVWGSPGSGKTLTSVKIARELSKKKKNVILVTCDEETPMIPVLLPSASGTKSLGALLSLPTLNQISIFQHFIPLGNSLSLLGYLLGENELQYAEYDERRAKDLIALLRRIADYVIIDCSHHMLTNVLTAVALEVSDIVLRVVNADLKSLSYIKSQKSYLQESRFQYDSQINVFNNVLSTQDTNPYQEAFGGDSYILPHIPALKVQYDEARLMESITGRDAKKYEPIIQEIVKETIIDE